jgi:hypothetical protein
VQPGDGNARVGVPALAALPQDPDVVLGRLGHLAVASGACLELGFHAEHEAEALADSPEAADGCRPGLLPLGFVQKRRRPLVEGADAVHQVGAVLDDFPFDGRSYGFGDVATGTVQTRAIGSSSSTLLHHPP